MDRRTPLCPTGHGPFGAAVQKGTLLSEYFCLVHERVTKIIGPFFGGRGASRGSVKVSKSQE